MPTRNVNLTDHLDAFVERAVREGRYQNASEVIRDGLRLLEERQSGEAARLEGLRSLVSQGLVDVEQDRVVRLVEEGREDWLDNLGRSY